MNIPAVNADYRIGVGSCSAGRSRRMGQIPAIIYDSQLNKMIEVNKKDLDSLLHTYGDNCVVNVRLGGDTIQSMIMEVQRHPISNEPIHIDFKPVSDTIKVHTRIPVRFIGLDQVKQSGGILQKQRQEIEVECMPQHVPKYITADLSNLTVGQSFTVQDIEIAEELTMLTKPTEVLATLTSPDNYVETATTVHKEQEENADK